MDASPRPEPGALQLALIGVIVSVFVVGCLAVGGGCVTMARALWGSFGQSTQIVTASIWTH